MNQSYKKQKQVRAFSLEPLSPMAFFHMSQPLVHTYVALGVLGGLTIGAVLLEKYLIQNDYISARNLYLKDYIMEYELVELALLRMFSFVL